MHCSAPTGNGGIRGNHFLSSNPFFAEYVVPTFPGWPAV
jgi:hypothetical protein